ncbi:MAG: S-layer homology domain-containing protein [Clostridia bacterium]|nr:S-layer homology domain-containing protein [Clostridia bacterium]
MKYKRNIILCILTSVMLFNICFPCFAQPEQFSADRFEIKNARLILSGKTPQKGDTVTIIVKNKSTQNIFLLDETVSGDDGNFSFDLKMPDVMKGNIAEGVFYVTLASNDNIITGKDYEFEFAGSVARSNFVDAVKQNPTMLQQMIENAENESVVKTIGIAIGDYNKLSSQNEKDGVISFFNQNTDIENLTEETLCSNFNAAIYAMYIKCLQAPFALEKLNYSYDDKSFSQISDNNKKNYISNSMNSKVYSSEEKMKADYKFYYSVYELNNAVSTEMSKILEKHKSALGIEESDEYKKFASLSGEYLTKAERALAQIIDKEAVTTVEKINAALMSAYNSATYVSSDSLNGGGSSKGGGSTVSFNSNVSSSENQNITDLPQTNGVFSDLDSVLWAKDSIEKLAELKIVSGIGDGLFAPDGLVKREEFIKMLVLALDVYDENAKCSFDDVNESDWYYTYIASALECKITLGTGNSKFGAGQYLKREDVAVILNRCINVEKQRDESFLFADDKDISDYAKESVYNLYANGVINGMGDSIFAPQETCTRAMAAKLIYSSIIESTGGDK